jgi:predicted Rossmann fold flavoprotein
MIVVIGGGPAGFFGALAAREADPSVRVMLLEKGGEVLRKVSVSGGGRCNVTHACFDPSDLITHYPRGGRELLGPFHHWGPAETVDWFASRGVELKTEDDGRMFPVTDDSATIVGCLRDAARESGVEVLTRKAVTSVEPSGDGLLVHTADGDLPASAVLLATGGQTSSSGGPDRTGRYTGGFALARSLGHTIIDPVPSLFTFRCQDPLLKDLAGVAADVRVAVAERPRGRADLIQSGPMLITHRGLSGPAVLKLSAWGARDLKKRIYAFPVAVDWLPGMNDQELDTALKERGREIGKQQVGTTPFPPLPRRLWAALVDRTGIDPDIRWGDLGRTPRRDLVRTLKDTRLAIHGQDTFKDEFVTCGGVERSEVDWRTMMSRACPGLFLAGEVLDVDGVTGGFNFQNCWTTGRLAGLGMVKERS